MPVRAETMYSSRLVWGYQSGVRVSMFGRPLSVIPRRPQPTLTVCRTVSNVLCLLGPYLPIIAIHRASGF